MQNVNLSNARSLLVEARHALGIAQDAEWDAPGPEAARKVDFWTKRVCVLSGMNPETVIPLH